jgi:hypothetical protein
LNILGPAFVVRSVTGGRVEVEGERLLRAPDASHARLGWTIVLVIAASAPAVLSTYATSDRSARCRKFTNPSGTREKRSLPSRRRLAPSSPSVHSQDWSSAVGAVVDIQPGERDRRHEAG